MAYYYNPEFPYTNPYQQKMQPVQTPVQYQPQTQIQNAGFISVRNETEARNYPLAPGNSITFKDESQPYLYVKTMGLSQFEQPTFEKFRLVKEEDPAEAKQPVGDYALRSDLEALRSEIETLKNSLKGTANAE